MDLNVPTISAPQSQNANGLIICAVPDTGYVGARVDGRGHPHILRPNSLHLSAGIKQSLLAQGREFWLPLPNRVQVPPIRWIVNTLADADEYAGTLDILSQLVEQVDVPVLNAPAGIQLTRRDRAPQVLGGIPGLTVPNCVRFEPKVPEDFLQVFEEHGFEYPVLVRPARSQTGTGLIKVDGADDWGKIFKTPWIGSAVYMTQFVDFRHASGHFIKARIVVAGDRVGMRHIMRSDSWHIHAMERTKQDADFEIPRIVGLKDWTSVQTIAKTAQERFGLDYFGIDVGLVDDETFVLFEANCAMSILSLHKLPTVRRQAYLKNIQSIEEDVVSAFAAKGVRFDPSRFKKIAPK